MRELVQSVAAGDYGSLRGVKEDVAKGSDKPVIPIDERLTEILGSPIGGTDEEITGPLDQESELSEEALEIYGFLKERESHCYPRGAFVRDYKAKADEETVKRWIQELVDNGYVEVRAGGIVAILEAA